MNGPIGEEALFWAAGGRAAQSDDVQGERTALGMAQPRMRMYNLNLRLPVEEKRREQHRVQRDVHRGNGTNTRAPDASNITDCSLTNLHEMSVTLLDIFHTSGSVFCYFM